MGTCRADRAERRAKYRAERAARQKLAKEMYLGGHPLKDIAAATGYSMGGVCTLMRRLGVALRGDWGRPAMQQPTASAARVLSLYNGGMSVVDVGAAAGVSRQRVHQILNRWQPSLSRRQHRQSVVARLRRIAGIKKARAAQCQPAPGKEGSDTPAP